MSVVERWRMCLTGSQEGLKMWGENSNVVGIICPLLLNRVNTSAQILEWDEVPPAPRLRRLCLRDVLCQKCPTFLSIYWTSLFRITRGKEKENAIAIVSGVYCKVTEWKVWITHRLLQVVLLPKHSFLHQLTQNMTLNLHNFLHFFVQTNQNTNQIKAK